MERGAPPGGRDVRAASGEEPSRIARERLWEEQAARDPGLREEARKAGRLRLADARARADPALVDEVRVLGITGDRTAFARAAAPFLSAEEMADALVGRRAGPSPSPPLDRVWVALSVLWERWLPERPSLERIDDWIHEGYAAEAGDPGAACASWLQVWPAVLAAMDTSGIRSLPAFDERLRGSRSVLGWVRDLERALWSAGLRDPAFLGEGVRLCEEYLARFRPEDPLAPSMRLALALHHVARGSSRKERPAALERLRLRCVEGGREEDAREVERRAGEARGLHSAKA